MIHLTTVERSRARAGYAMFAPAAVLFTIFLALPVVGVVILAFTNWRYPSSPRLSTRFVGLDNLDYLLQDSDFLAAIGHNVAFTAVIVPLQTGLALGIALLVDKPLPGRSFFRAAFFIPYAVPIAVSALIWKIFFDDGAGRRGLASTVVHTLTGGQVEPDWWGRAGWAWLAVVLVSLWCSVAFQMVILLAALQEVPQQLHEAAMMDGAGAVQRFRAVTLPAIRRPLYLVVTVTTLWSFRLFDMVYVLPPGPGEPRGTTSAIMLYIVRLALRVPAAPIGRACAAALAFLVIVLGVNAVLRRFEPQE